MNNKNININKNILNYEISKINNYTYNLFVKIIDKLYNFLTSRYTFTKIFVWQIVPKLSLLFLK